MVLEIQCFHGIGAFEVHRSEVSALKFSHPSVCSVLRLFGLFLNYDTVSRGEGEGGGNGVNHHKGKEVFLIVI
ncbi:MAG: hypothetical protein COZ69_00950 [Deltaproteobacteria bacterium CG_4_8_14_3_um_filter_45_9]|nr:MAG: hypothetical protein COS40_01650 [Deltaproteobacteria bacterium CG03_land_8_20_14_0_80_45_14]PIX26320.1 MAG: hypothetical protein COZ69_00950 [Deltaproteobacteria bacterium CG_4_8_14_3_um_filter_45_9]